MDVEKLLAQIEATPASASTRMVFGEPIKVGERTVVPVARVKGSFGLGFGKGKNKPEQAGEPSTREEPGGGGGGNISVRPVAVVDITPERVRVLPIVDTTRVATAAMLMVAWNIFWVTLTVRMLRRSRLRRLREANP